MLSTAEIAGEKRGSTPYSHAASANVEPYPAKGDPERYASILPLHFETKALFPSDQSTELEGLEE